MLQEFCQCPRNRSDWTTLGDLEQITGHFILKKMVELNVFLTPYTPVSIIKHFYDRPFFSETKVTLLYVCAFFLEESYML